LEFGWKEPVITRNENALAWLALGPGCVDYRLGHVMKELNERIKGSPGRTAVAPV
jgi:hypothetical protein